MACTAKAQATLILTVSIGNPELIALRPNREVDIPPGGTLADYIPFYFTPYSPMLDTTCRELGVKVKFVHRTQWFFS